MRFRHRIDLLLVGAGSFAVFAILRAAYPVVSTGLQANLTKSSLGASRGCRTGGIGGINVTEPSWVSVEASDRPTLVEGMVTDAFVTFEDWPFAHDSHDLDWYVVPDPGYERLMSDANPIFGGKRNLGIEWETKYYPMRFWPAAGDRGWMLGRWIFDCGHPPYHTEIHPPIATGFTRLEPHIFKGDTSPSFTNKTVVYISGNGGYYVQKVGGRDYVMEFPLPPKPSPSAQPKVELISGPASGLPSPVLSIKNGRNGKQVLEIRCPLSGVADSTPKFSLYDWIKEARKKRTVLNPKWPPMNRPNNPLVYSAVIVSGWHEKNNAVKKYRRIKVTFDSVQIHEDHDPLGQAEWNLYLRANGTWLKAPLPAKVKRGETYPLGRSAEFLIPEEGSVRLQAQGWEADNDRFFRVGTPPDILDSLAKDENEDLGKIEKGFGFPAGFGVGSHIIKSNRSDYTIKVTISETARFP